MTGLCDENKIGKMGNHCIDRQYVKIVGVRREEDRGVGNDTLSENRYKNGSID